MFRNQALHRPILALCRRVGPSRSVRRPWPHARERERPSGWSDQVTLAEGPDGCLDLVAALLVCLVQSDHGPLPEDPGGLPDRSVRRRSSSRTSSS